MTASASARERSQDHALLATDGQQIPGRTRTTAVALSVASVLVGIFAPTASARVPTRLVSKPLAFRLTGQESLSSFSNLQDYRYAVVFKLNRDPVTRERGLSDEETEDLPDGTVVPTDGAVTRGNYYLRGYELGVGHFYAKEQTTKRNANCFVGFIDDGNPRFLRGFGRVRLRSRVRFTLHPSRYDDDYLGGVGFDPLRYTRPRLRQADVRLNDRSTKRLLKHIGCAPRRR